MALGRKAKMDGDLLRIVDVNMIRIVAPHGA